jgi:hypothetical protein
MTITAKNIGRINVWPTYATAEEADTEESKFVGQLTVWRTNEEARANISHEEEGGGGGGAPDWVPANAVIHIDLVGGTPQGRAWVAGTGEVAVDTLLGTDPNAETGLGVTWYDPANLTVDGYRVSEGGGPKIAAISLLRDKMLDSATSVARTKLINPGNGTQFSTFLISVDGVNGIETSYSADLKQRLFAYTGSLTLESASDVVNYSPDVAGAINIIASTITSTRAENSVNGFEALAGTLTEDERPSGNSMAAVAFIYDPSSALQSITLYDPLPSTAGLSELSEV